MLEMQEQAVGLQKYLQQLGQLAAFQKGIQQVLGKDPKQALQSSGLQGNALPQKPRTPISGLLLRGTFLIILHTACGQTQETGCMAL